jgi:ribosomal protein S18 acetylase RimI-like enzyme
LVNCGGRNLKSGDDLKLELLEEIAKKGNKFHFKSFGASMLPLIRAGDILTIKPIKLADLNLGDVILYQNNGKPLVNRLIKKRKLYNSPIFILKGDFLPHSDNPIDKSQIFGKVVNIDRNSIKINYNTFWRKKFNLLLARFYPLTYPILKCVYEILTIIGSASRKIKKNLTSKNITYQMISDEDLLELANFYETDIQHILENIKMGSFYFRAKLSNQIMGVLIVNKFWRDLCPDKYWIIGFHVKPKYRGKGVGENLLLATISELEKKEFNKIFVNVFETNTPALKLYNKLGFKPLNKEKIEDKINKHYDKVAPGSPQSLVLYLDL